MRRDHSLRHAVAAFLATATLTLSACSDTPATASHATLHDDIVPSSAVASPGLLKQVHAATARYNSTTQALRAGYAEDLHCVAVPGLGGMGYHWGNGAAIDPVFNALEPEVLLYAPDKNGNLKLVAVEYIVIDVGQPAPTFDGHPFDVRGTPVPVPHWSLHVWLYQDNPNGIFTPFNPTVSCPS